MKGQGSGGDAMPDVTGGLCRLLIRWRIGCGAGSDDLVDLRRDRKLHLRRGSWSESCSVELPFVDDCPCDGDMSSGDRIRVGDIGSGD